MKPYRLSSCRRERRTAEYKSLRFWSAAVSTGQEAYSLAMLLLRRVRGLECPNPRHDFSSKVLERARSATYQQIEVNRGLPTALLVKYFSRSSMEWKLADNVRKMARFESIDLRKSMRTLGFRLVFCRTS